MTFLHRCTSCSTTSKNRSTNRSSSTEWPNSVAVASQNIISLHDLGRFSCKSWRRSQRNLNSTPTRTSTEFNCLCLDAPWCHSFCSLLLVNNLNGLLTSLKEISIKLHSSQFLSWTSAQICQFWQKYSLQLFRAVVLWLYFFYYYHAIRIINEDIVTGRRKSPVNLTAVTYKPTSALSLAHLNEQPQLCRFALRKIGRALEKICHKQGFCQFTLNQK